MYSGSFSGSASGEVKEQGLVEVKGAGDRAKCSAHLPGSSEAGMTLRSCHWPWEKGTRLSTLTLTCQWVGSTPRKGAWPWGSRCFLAFGDSWTGLSSEIPATNIPGSWDDECLGLQGGIWDDGSQQGWKHWQDVEFFGGEELLCHLLSSTGLRGWVWLC